MKIKIKLHANSSQEKIKELEKDFYEVWIKEKPIDGKANKSLEKFLRKYFRQKVHCSVYTQRAREPLRGPKLWNKRAKIVSGLKSKNKVIEIF